MSFLAYDLTLLGVFVVLLGIFLYRKRKDVKKDGILLLYRTSWGIKLIHRVGEKYQKTLKVLSYVSVTMGYALMAAMLWFVGRIVWLYSTNFNHVVTTLKIPPIMPLIPYLPQAFGLNFLPPFYFTYWIIIIAVVAITHEFAHGIFAARSKVGVKSTGFGFFPFFLPIFLAAFVELDEKKMAKKKKFDQLAVLSAGTFANIITAVVFFGVLVGFFAIAFSPAGVSFNTYPYNAVSTSSITSVNGISISNASYQNILNKINESGLNRVQTSKGNYLITKDSLEKQNSTPNQLVMYYDAPAIKANLESIIMDVNGKKITSIEQLGDEIHKFNPGDTITLTVMGNDSKPYNRTITLGASPQNESTAWLGIGFLNSATNEGWLYQFSNTFSSFTRNDVYYASSLGELGIFIYNLLWWLVIISFSVALLNMLPMGIFDGGRFFYLTVWGITKNEKFAKAAYKFMTYLFLAALLVVMFFWVYYIR